MIRAARIRWIVLCVGVGVAGSYVSGWVDAVCTQRAMARRSTIPLVPSGCQPLAADPDMVAVAPPGWPTEGWSTYFDWYPHFDHAHVYVRPSESEWCYLMLGRARHGWPWRGVQSVESAILNSGNRRARDPEEERVAGVVELLGLPRSAWAPFEEADPQAVQALADAAERQPFWRRGLTVLNPDAPPAQHTLPIEPVWPAFAYNALVYGGGAWALLAAPSLVGLVTGRKRRRRQRGLCVACGYDLTGLDACPECGRAKAGRSVERPAGEDQSRL